MNGFAPGYTAVLCAAAPCRTETFGETTTTLRECVRTSRHGVLVTSGCTLGALSCRLRPPGPLLVVQPCDDERRPLGPAVRIGPVIRPDDISSIEGWIRGDRLDPTLLPSHLMGLHRRTRGAGQN
ncbi:hypothetical protein ACU61A_24970 [Pseudonocardia sichuanensis]|uniref:Uncharacterized protein n=1 Tax=Pseudonocardia kunmingensis TaxID=630975 RepID=A0A543D9X2_9PSEU|nr:hypothetical protein [Pseudonocardia kunmingensis]TQM06078.1 hypothetical protein FB558_6313 [Pseudonocardia kunmingensis]